MGCTEISFAFVGQDQMDNALLVDQMVVLGRGTRVLLKHGHPPKKGTNWNLLNLQRLPKLENTWVGEFEYRPTVRIFVHESTTQTAIEDQYEGSSPFQNSYWIAYKTI